MRNIYRITSIIAFISMLMDVGLFPSVCYSKESFYLRVPISTKLDSDRAKLTEIYLSSSLKARKTIDAFESRREIMGGKNAWDEILEGLAEKIGFNIIPDAVRMSIKEIWGDFIEQNKPLVDGGNNLISSDIEENGRVSEDTIKQLRKIIRRFVFPNRSTKLIKLKTDRMEGRTIIRSSGRREDSFIRNLAGIFSSPKRKSEYLISQGVRSMLEQAINVVWIEQNSLENPIKGVPNLLTKEEGFGALIERFLEFDASGTAMSNLYGHTTIEAVIGDADTAVRSIYANVAQFLFQKGQESHTGVFEYNPTFLTTPYGFRLKGKEYSAVRNIEELQKVMQDYPKIDGKASPLTKEQAIEVNRVVNALEEELGIVLDVEWGYLNGELYIVQIRPIIGDFKEPLVDIDAVLSKKKLIAETPSAIGHTREEGFTGSLVLFGTGVDAETVAKFEEEFGKEYMRVQSDVALAVFGTQTKAKVLIDPVQGSRQAHRINLITDRIADGNFVYANGPVLREGLEKNIEFIPHPELRGVWISEQEVTYFSNGLKGDFYGSDRKGETMKLDEDYGRQEALIGFQNEVKGTWLKDDIGIPEHAWILKAMVEFRFGAGFGRGIEEMFVDMRHEENCNLDFIRNKIMAFDYNKSDLKWIQHELSLLEEALSFPLYPSDWESPRLKSFKNILFLKDILEKLKEESQSKKENEIPVQYIALLLDPYNARKPVESQLRESIKDAQITRVSSEELLTTTSPKIKIHPDQLSAIKTPGTVSAIYVHVNDYYDFSSLFTVLTKIRQENADALIIIEGQTLSGNEFDRFVSEYGRIILKTREVFDNEKVINLIQEDHLKWLARKKITEKETITSETQGLPVQSIAEGIIFVVNDDDADDFADFIRNGLRGKHTVIPVGFMVGLEGALEEHVPSIVIADTHLMDKDEWDNIYKLVSAKNPKVKFILTDNEAAIFPKEDMKSRNIIGIVEKPFYFQDVLKIIQSEIPLKSILKKTNQRSVDSGA